MKNNIVIEHFPNKDSVVNDGSKQFESKCINCKNKRCIKYLKKEIQNELAKIPTNIDDKVCPVDAIKCINDKIVIDNNKCIKCGLCASRCLTGAIYYCNDKFNIAESSDGDEETYESAIHTGQIINESDEILNIIYDNIFKNHINPNIISRNLLNECGIQTVLSRKGDVNLRMDAIIFNNDKRGICEIEFNNDVLSCPRCILDDLAVLCSRYDYDLSETLALVVALGLPNNRTDYWRVVKDINDILNIQIQTISIGMLLIAMWNFKKVNLIDKKLYKNSDDNSLKDNIEILLNRKVNVISSENNILEPLK